LLLIVPLPHEQEQSVTKSVNDNLELTERVFTTEYIYAVKECCRHAKDNWNISTENHTRIALHDEKWFWGMVCRGDAKACEELGISPVIFAAYHKSHVSKVIAAAVVGFTFEDSMDYGGEAMKLGFYHAQNFKVAQKLQRESVRQPNGLLQQNGSIIRRKGDKYMIDCCVTGSTQGTMYDPKFALKDMFEFFCLS
jgi:hypothetical protein